MKEPKRLGELIPMTSATSLTDKLTAVHRGIIKSKTTAKDSEFTEATFRQAIAIVVTACGIKSVPDELSFAVILADYKAKYSKQINRHEFNLAFRMNIQGDLRHSKGKDWFDKVEHYQAFTSEFMCSVLNQYLAKRADANKEAIKVEANTIAKELLTPDNTNLLLEQLIKDRKEYSINADCALNEGFTTEAKLNMLNELFEVDVKPETIIPLRVKAIPMALKELAEQLHRAKATQKFGREIEISNRIARIKTGFGLSDVDEYLIQSMVRALIIRAVFDNYSESVFIEHVELNQR